MRMIESDRLRGVKAVEINQFAASGGIDEARAAAFFQIENQLNMVLELRIAASLPLIK